MAVVAPAIAASGVAVANPTGQVCDVVFAGGTVQAMSSVSPLSNLPASITPPAVPATTVAATNTFGCAALVQIGANGATITAVTVAGSGAGTAAGYYLVPAGATISITYTVATPTWTWTPVSLAVVGNGGNVSAGTPIGVPQGGTVALWYSVVPTSWTWTDPPDLDEFGYSAENTQAINEIAQVPLPAHTEGGETGLGTGVSN